MNIIVIWINVEAQSTVITNVNVVRLAKFNANILSFVQLIQ